MKKSIVLIIIAVILIGGVLYAVWYLNKQREFSDNTRDIFVPNNSAIVVNISPDFVFSSKVLNFLKPEIQKFDTTLLAKTLRIANESVKSNTAATMAIRMEGKSKLTFLYIIESHSINYKNSLNELLKTSFPVANFKERKYDGFRILQSAVEKEYVYYAVEGGMLLLSDSELYVEDALKQYAGDGDNSNFKKIDRYFSAGAGLNVFLKKDFFTEVMPYYLQTNKLFEHFDTGKLFEWSALDGYSSDKGLMFNGFMSSGGYDVSYMKALASQTPKEGVSDKIIPADAMSVISLNLSDNAKYFTALDNYRYSAGIIDHVRKRKSDFARMIGKSAETELRELLQGEFVSVNMSYDYSDKEHDGALVMNLKSGGLCKAWLDKILNVNAKYRNLHPDNYRKTYTVDREKSFTYYTFPVEDFGAVSFGYIFGNIKNRYALILDNYLILASSEKVVGDFVKTYLHNYSIKDIDWYKNSKNQLSGKYNLSYIANISKELSYYSSIGKGDLETMLGRTEDIAETFSSFSVQWSNEKDMLYTIVYLGTEKITSQDKPHLMWQTKLDAPMKMKPAVVTNHQTGEKEFLIQDEANTIYLVNNSGRILWKQLIEGQINSEVFQVDALKNGKLQYLFSTPTKIYLIDRNGNAVNRFPVSFRSGCKTGITVYDYDKKRDYRIFAPCADQKVYLYDIEGKLIEGWKHEKADKEIVSDVKYCRIKNKDYIIYADRHRLYICDRKGNERVKVSSVFDLPDKTDIYVTDFGGVSVIVFSNITGEINVVDFTGKVRKIKCEEMTSESYLNVDDVDRDGNDDFIVSSGSRLAVYDFMGRRTFFHDYKKGTLGFPYVYRFSSSDIRIGLIDSMQNKVLLTGLKNGISKGFPITGESPFSIIFGQLGEFYLFAGTDGGNFIKYRVQK
ncbi:MAG: WD40 repeat domain-containing protein [Culturomica sp.]|jgi:hypothetical protein|nr:WD40 repeat domain-containing protein [Culturomica sp.]